jgi:hypothetical protein
VEPVWNYARRVGQRDVNARQVEVLQWIADGCPAGVMDGHTYKTVALALQGRRLATVSRKGGAWSASPTDAGRYYLKHGRFPDGHWPARGTAQKRNAPNARRHVPPESERSVEHASPDPAHAQDSAPPQARAVDPAAQLVADVVAAGGSLIVDDEDGAYQRLAALARASNLVPTGKRLVIGYGGNWSKKEISLVDRPAWMDEALPSVPVGQMLRSPHPIVAELRADKNELQFSKDARQRALLILDAVAKEALRRGWTVARAQRTGTIQVAVRGHGVDIIVKERSTRSDHVLTAKELRDKERYSWSYAPRYDFTPTGRLHLELSGGGTVRQGTFQDTKTQQVETKLAVLLQEIGLRADAADEHERRLERERQAREAHWERVRARAAVRLQEHHRAEVLATQVDLWHHHRLEGDYIAALEQRTKELTGDERAAAEEWVSWAKRHHDSSDPLQEAIAMPGEVKPTPDALAPFMEGLSPYGPRHRSW